MVYWSCSQVSSTDFRRCWVERDLSFISMNYTGSHIMCECSQRVKASKQSVKATTESVKATKHVSCCECPRLELDLNNNDACEIKVPKSTNNMNRLKAANHCKSDVTKVSSNQNECCSHNTSKFILRDSHENLASHCCNNEVSQLYHTMIPGVA